MMRSAIFFLLPAVAVAAPVPKEAKDASQLLVRTGDRKLHRIAPDGSTAAVVYEWGEKESVHDAQLSPGGTAFAFLRIPAGNAGGVRLLVRTVDGKEEKELAKLSAPRGHFWSADGKSVYAVEEDDEQADRNPRGRGEFNRSWVIDAASGEKKKLDVGGPYRPAGLIPGTGKIVCVRFIKGDGPGANGRQTKVETVTTAADKFDPAVVIPEEGGAVPLAAFPDGKRFLARGHATDEIGIYDTAAKTFTEWKTQKGRTAFALRPDGKRVAFTQGVEKGNVWSVFVADPDGTNASVVWKSDSPIYEIDWR